MNRRGDLLEGPGDCTLSGMKSVLRRKCKHCRKFYHPDPRTQHHQRYCSTKACQRASKTASQRRWLAQPGNQDYFRGPDQVARVKAWRKQHADYWKSPRKKDVALQEMISAQAVDHQADKKKLLQEMISLQPVAMVGLISQLTGQALQEEIVTQLRQYHTRGQMILGMVPTIRAKGNGYARETSVGSRSVAPGT